MTISYVGQLGRKLSTGFDINRAPANAKGSQVRRRFYCVGGAYTVGVGTAADTCTNGTLLPNVTTIQQTFSTGASSYHSLQATFERRFSNGLGFSANTTWAHLLDNAPNINGQSGNGVGQVLATQNYDDYGNGDLDTRNRVVVTGNYALPWGKGTTGIRNFVTAGWHANVLNLWSTGLPFTVLNTSNVSGTSPNGSSDRPNLVSSAFSNIVPGTGNTSGDVQFFNGNIDPTRGPVAFATQAAGAFGYGAPQSLPRPSLPPLGCIGVQGLQRLARNQVPVPRRGIQHRQPDKLRQSFDRNHDPVDFWRSYLNHPLVPAAPRAVRAQVRVLKTTLAK